jgi:hypothetical protein
MHSTVGDLYFIPNVVNVSTYTWSAQAISQTGITFTTVTQEIHETLTTLGNDQKQFASLFRVSAGDATGYLIYTATSSGSSLSSPQNPMGIGHFVRIRQSDTAQTWMSSGINNYSPDDAEADTVDANNNFGNGLVSSWEGEYNTSIQEIEGVKHYACHCDFSDVSSVSDPIRRRQELHGVPWEPDHIEGTKAYIGLKFSLVDHTQSDGGIIFIQDHTGSNGLAAPNYPLWYLEIAYPNQWGPGYAGGFLNFAYGMNYTGGVASKQYEKFEDINFIGSGTHEFYIEVYYHRTNGSIRIEYNGVEITNKTGIPTVATTPEQLGNGVAGTGSTALVGGAIKVGGYHHQVTGLSSVTSNAARVPPHLEFKPMIRSFCTIHKLPSDIDYADDTTASNDLYELMAA